MPSRCFYIKFLGHLIKSMLSKDNIQQAILESDEDG